MTPAGSLRALPRRWFRPRCRNYFVTRQGSARCRDVMALACAQLIDELPLPRPRYEILCIRPASKAYALRGSAQLRVAGCAGRFAVTISNRILGLVKAQAVKSAVIVPVGAKGGFGRHPRACSATPPPTATPPAPGSPLSVHLGLLDVTDSVDHATAKRQPPPGGAT